MRNSWIYGVAKTWTVNTDPELKSVNFHEKACQILKCSIKLKHRNVFSKEVK